RAPDKSHMIDTQTMDLRWSWGPPADFGKQGLRQVAFRPRPTPAAQADPTVAGWGCAAVTDGVHVWCFSEGGGLPAGPPLRPVSGAAWLAVSPAGWFVLVGGNDGSVRRFAVEDGRPLGEPLRHPRGVVWGPRLADDGRRVWTC